jgi:hypothetical protein
MYSFGYKYMESFLFMKGLIQNYKVNLMTSNMLRMSFLKCTTTVYMFGKTAHIRPIRLKIYGLSHS